MYEVKYKKRKERKGDTARRDNKEQGDQDSKKRQNKKRRERATSLFIPLPFTVRDRIASGNVQFVMLGVNIYRNIYDHAHNL